MKTANKLKTHVKKFCRQVTVAQKPIYISVSPIPNTNYNDCFTIVSEHIALHGGEQILGWAIWEWPRVMIEAEFHAIWRAPSGELIDITPREIEISRILFQPDPSRDYHGRQVDNIRHPLRDDPLIKNFINLAEERYRLLNEGDLADYHGPIEATPQLINVISNMKSQQLALARKYGAPL